MIKYFEGSFSGSVISTSCQLYPSCTCIRLSTEAVSWSRVRWDRSDTWNLVSRLWLGWNLTKIGRKINNRKVLHPQMWKSLPFLLKYQKSILQHSANEDLCSSTCASIYFMWLRSGLLLDHCNVYCILLHCRLHSTSERPVLVWHDKVEHRLPWTLCCSKMSGFQSNFIQDGICTFECQMFKIHSQFMSRLQSYDIDAQTIPALYTVSLVHHTHVRPSTVFNWNRLSPDHYALIWCLPT